MNDDTIRQLRALLDEKLKRYTDLHGCFHEEKASLIDIDVDRLWQLSRRKEAICKKIELIRQRIARTFISGRQFSGRDLKTIINSLPSGKEGDISILWRRILQLKREIDNMRKENLQYVRQSLRFLDEILSTITGDAATETRYGVNRKLQKRFTASLLSREI